MCFSSNKNRELKVKLWLVGARKKNKSAFFVTFILSAGNYFNNFFFQGIFYWINFQNIYTFTYQNHYLIHFFCLFLKSSKALSILTNFWEKIKKRLKCSFFIDTKSKKKYFVRYLFVFKYIWVYIEPFLLLLSLIFFVDISRKTLHQISWFELVYWYCKQAMSL